MNSLQIVIKKDCYEIHTQDNSRSLVSNIRRMDEALDIYRELVSSSIHPPGNFAELGTDWFVAPGVLATN